MATAAKPIQSKKYL